MSVAGTEQMTVADFIRPTKQIYQTYGDGPFIDLLMKAGSKDEDQKSSQEVSKGVKRRPFDFNMVMVFKNSNVHHSTCIETKKESTVGIGFESEKVSDTLDPLCGISYQDVLGDVAEDYWQTGNGYKEVVRGNDGQKITGLHHLPATDVEVVIEDELFHRHYKIFGKEMGGEKRFAAYGDLEDFKKRSAGRKLGFSIDPNKKVSEVIHFRRSTSLSRWYGFPDWLSATASIELVQCLHQHTFDFFLNRGVPEFLLFLTGAQVQNADWDKLKQAMGNHIGLGNSHKSQAVNIPSPNVKVQVEKLAMESQTDGSLFSDMNETLALNIVSAHRVPPLLAGIQIPGKLGATNELPNALMAFQILVIGPAQHNIETTLDVTLGDPAKNGGLGLKKGDFKFKEITKLIDPAQMDTVARMRTPLASGRDPADGLRKEEDIDERRGLILGHALSEGLRRMMNGSES